MRKKSFFVAVAVLFVGLVFTAIAVHAQRRTASDPAIQTVGARSSETIRRLYLDRDKLGKFTLDVNGYTTEGPKGSITLTKSGISKMLLELQNEFSGGGILPGDWVKEDPEVCTCWQLCDESGCTPCTCTPTGCGSC